VRETSATASASLNVPSASTAARVLPLLFARRCAVVPPVKMHGNKSSQTDCTAPCCRDASAAAACRCAPAMPMSPKKKKKKKKKSVRSKRLPCHATYDMPAAACKPAADMKRNHRCRSLQETPALLLPRFAANSA